MGKEDPQASQNGACGSPPSSDGGLLAHSVGCCPGSGFESLGAPGNVGHRGTGSDGKRAEAGQSPGQGHAGRAGRANPKAKGTGRGREGGGCETQQRFSAKTVPYIGGRPTQ
jgi:hypothetical protein